MKIDDILAHNAKLIEAISNTNKRIESLTTNIEILKEKLVAPCSYCEYDGVYRCEACKANYYAAGFNVPNYPNE